MQYELDGRPNPAWVMWTTRSLFLDDAPTGRPDNEIIAAMDEWLARHALALGTP